MTCAACSREASGEGRFCRFCGTSLADGRSTLAGLFTRFVANVLDVVLGYGILFAALFIGGATGDAVVILVVLLVAAIAALVWWVRLMSQGQTPGKRMMGLRVVKTSGEPATLGTMILRDWIAKTFISGLFFSLGYIWAVFDRDRQAWHDKLASTVVVREAVEVGRPTTAPAP